MLKFEGTDKIRDIKYEDGYVDKIYYDNNTLLVFTSDKEKTGVDEVLFKGRRLIDVTSYGKCSQNGTPTPDAPMDIVSNNGVLKARHQSGLPLGYTRLNYIESTGTQYIDTGLKLNQNNIVEVDWMYYTESTITTSGRIFGARYTSGSINSFAVGSSTGKSSAETVVFGQFDNNFVLASNNIVIGQWNTYKVSADGFYINDIKQGDFGGSTFETPFTVKLFAFEQASSSSATPSIGCGVGRSKQFKVWNGDTLVMNLIPAKNSSNVVGMYDLVSGQFFTNQGTGDFVAGNDVNDPVEIYTDGTVETINVHGKNLYNPVTTTADIILTDVGAETPNAGGSVSDYIKIKPSTTYTLSFVRTDYRIYTRVCTYSADKTFVGLKVKDTVTTAGYKTYTFTTEATVLYIRFCFKSDSTNIQLEQGSTATTYEQYYDGGTATAEMLLKVGDYQDVQSIIDGVVTRNVGVKVLDGTEPWLYYSSISGLFYSEDVIVDNKLGISAFDLISNQYTATDSLTLADNYSIRFQLKSASELIVTSHRLYVRNTDFGTVADFTQHLANQYANGTPVIVVYPLATPTTEQVDGQQLTIQQGNNTVEVTQASVDDIQLKVKYK